MRGMYIIIVCAVAIQFPLAAQQKVLTTSKDVKGVSLTIYNQNFAVIREKREFGLHEGINLVRYEDVAAQIDPTSLSFKSLTAPNSVAVREQNYQYDLLTPQAVLNKSTGKTVQYKQTYSGGKTEILSGTLLSTNEGTVLKADDGRIILNPSGEITVDALPEGLVSRPSLLWKLDVGKSGIHQTEVNYLSNGLNWKADYVAVVAENESIVDITGWVTLDNKSGATYRNAQLQLLAGDVRRVQEGGRMRDEVAGRMLAKKAVSEEQFQEESFFEYHLYTLDGFTDIRDRETKQMTLMSAADVSVNRKLVFDLGRRWYYSRGGRGPGQGSSTEEGKINVVLELKNSKDNNMGMPLPKGKVRVYKADKRGNLQFLGEDLIDHTPKDETVKFYIGDAFDVTGTRKQTDFNRVSDRVTEVSYEISIRNHKNEDAKVYAVEHMWGDWTILKQSHDSNKIDATTAEFPVTVPKDGEVKIKYTVRYKW